MAYNPGVLKRLSHVATYAAILEASRVSLKTFREHHHLVLGGFGTDAELLLALDVPPSHIWIAEKNKTLSNKLQCRAGTGNCRVINSDVLNVAVRIARERWPLLTVNLDMCTKLHLKAVNKIVDVLGVCRNPLFFAVTLCAKRETETSVLSAINSARTRLVFPEEEDWAVSALARASALDVLMYPHLQHTTLQRACYPSIKHFGEKPVGITTSMATLIGALAPRQAVLLPQERLNILGEDDMRMGAQWLRATAELKAPKVAQLLDCAPMQVRGWFGSDTRREST